MAQLLHSTLLKGLGLGRLRGRSAKALTPQDDTLFSDLISCWPGARRVDEGGRNMLRIVYLNVIVLI